MRAAICSGEPGPVVGLSLAAAVDQFSFGSGPTVQALFGGTTPASATLPGDPADDAGLDLFVARYIVTGASPKRGKAPELNSQSDTHIVEEIEFVVEKVERE